MLIRSKKTGKVYEVIGDDKVPEGFEEVSKAGGKTEKNGEAPSRAGFDKNTAHRKSRGGKSESSVVRSAKATEAKSSSDEEKIAEEIQGADVADGEVYEWVEVDDFSEEGADRKEKKNGRA